MCETLSVDLFCFYMSNEVPFVLKSRKMAKDEKSAGVIWLRSSTIFRNASVRFGKVSDLCHVKESNSNLISSFQHKITEILTKTSLR